VYSILISILVGIVVGVVYTLLGFWKTWAMGIILGVVIALATFILLARLLAKRFEPAFLQAQKQIQSGASQLALKTLEDLLPLARWQVMLKGQIHAQMGLLCSALDDDQAAFKHLEQASLRVPDAQASLAAIHFRKKRYDQANEVMSVAIKANKKHLMLYHVYAYMLVKEGKKEEAIEQMRKALKVEPSNEDAKDNLLRMQNNRKLNMKRLGMPWYGLKLEKPPASMRQMAPGSQRGFRGKQRKQKRR
jgi:tetratricopeptide (TPR) repeat protein